MRALLALALLAGGCVSSDDTAAPASCGARPQQPALSYGEAGPDAYTVTRSTFDAELSWRAAIIEYAGCLEVVR